MKEFKVGDRVVMRGVVKEIDSTKAYPVIVDSGGEEMTFTKEGKYRESHIKPQIHHDDAKEFPRLMEVRNNETKVNGEEAWYQRMVVGFWDGIAYAIADIPYGDVNALPYKNYREIQEPEVIELTIDQIAEKFGTKAELIKIKK